jgi:hypothetical protein
MMLRPGIGASCTVFSLMSADGRRIGLQQRRLARHQDSFGHRPNLHFHVDAGAVTGGEIDAGVHGLKAL